MNTCTHSFVAGMIAGTLVVLLVIGSGALVLLDKSETIAPQRTTSLTVERNEISSSSVFDRQFSFYEIKHVDGSRCFVYHGSGGWEPTMQCRIEPNKTGVESVVPSEGDQLQ